MAKIAAAEPRPIASARMTVTLKSGARLRERKAWEKRGIMKGARRVDLGALRREKGRGFVTADGRRRTALGLAPVCRGGVKTGPMSDGRHPTSDIGLAAKSGDVEWIDAAGMNGGRD